MLKFSQILRKTKNIEKKTIFTDVVFMINKAAIIFETYKPN